MEASIVLLPGDGIGPEVVGGAVEVLQEVATAFGHEFTMREYPVGGCAIDDYGVALPEDTLSACREADAILLGAVGGPKWDDPQAAVRPEQGLLGLRKSLGLYANLRPVQPDVNLLDASPIRPERLRDVDLMVVRELTGDVYFGEPRLRRVVDGEIQAVDTMAYTESEVRRVAHMAFQLARERRRKVSSVDKANVLESSRLWRQVVIAVGEEYPDMQLEHILVDAAAMLLISSPASFDVILTSNLFGDILTDEASVLTGSMGNLPSASLGTDTNRFERPRGLYEPIHGSAPDIAGKGIANPIAQILSASMMLRYSFGDIDAADGIDQAVSDALDAGIHTPDIAKNPKKAVGTKEMGDAIVERLTRG